MSDFETAAGRIWASRSIADDFASLCGFGGRYAGTSSEAEAREFLARRLAEAGGGTVLREAIPYRGWDRGPASVTLANGAQFPASGLGRSPSTPAGGVRAPLLDLGRGTPADFALAGENIRGCIVLVRHEYMLASGHIHRRRKYEAAKAAGAAGFLIAYNRPGNLLVTGSAGLGTDEDIPCAGISYEAGAALSAQGEAEITLIVEGRFLDRTAENLFLDLPGRTAEQIVLSAHIDGHDLAQSAIDNASGLASALAVAAALRDIVPRLQRGLRIAFFNVEEWAMIGSREHLARLSAAERRIFAFNVNLDSVAGSSTLAAMTSGLPAAESIIRRLNVEHGFGIRMMRPFMGNSDHGNYIAAGVPALRFCAGMDEPDSNLRYQLTAGDTADKVNLLELKSAAAVAAAAVLIAAEMDLAPLDNTEIARVTSAV